MGCFGALALVVTLSTEARAEDWSAFIDTNHQQLTKVQGPSKQAAPTPAPRAATKAAAAKPTKVAKVNARAKAKKHR